MKKKWLFWVLAIVGILGLIFLVSAIRGRYSLTVSHYDVPLKNFSETIRVVQLSDLHNREFGENNTRLLDKIKEQQPDLILVTGDLVTEILPESQPALSLLERLTKIAPVYVSLGNHEIEYTQRFGQAFIDRLKQTGVVLLEREYVDLEVKGQRFRLGGLYGYCLPAIYLQTGEADQGECDFLQDFLDTPEHTVLMCHMPVCWLINGSLEHWPVDCVFSGHAHGGQVRIPGLGGIYAPDQGFFPGWVEGLRASQDGQRHLVISRGLGSSVPLPRVFNVPEIVVVDFVPGQHAGN